MSKAKDRLRQLSDTGQHARDVWVRTVAPGIAAGSRVLDVGAGPCRYRNLFAHCDYRAHDLARYEGTSEGIHRDDWSYGALDVVSEIITLPVRTGALDVVLCTEVLEHVPDPSAAITELGRVLRSGGRLFLTAPLRSGLHQEPYHFYGGFTPHFYRRELPTAGLAPDRIAPVGGLFSSLAEDTIRASRIITRDKWRGRYSPARFLTRALLEAALPLWLGSLDRDLYYPEFTSDYLVEATKL